MTLFRYLICCCVLFSKEKLENSLKPGCLQGTESESEINEASKHIAISNVTVTFEGERCFHTVLTTEENAPTTVTEMSDTTLEIRTSDLKSTALESVESRCVRQGNGGDAKMRGDVRECRFKIAATRAFVAAGSQTQIQDNQTWHSQLLVIHIWFSLV